MANPRMINGFKEIHTQRATFSTDDSLSFMRDQPYGTDQHRAPVIITENGTVGLAEEGDIPFGALERIEADGQAVVAYHGMVQFAGTASYGEPVVADGNGGVTAGADGAGRGFAVHTPDDASVIVFFG